MKTVLAINSSKRKKNTYKVLIQIKNILEKNDINVEIINLYDYNIYTCIGCEKCILTYKCVLQKDDVNVILNKIEKSDGVILSSPVYLQSVSGKLKTLIDRTCVWFHRPTVYGKPIMCVSTTKGSGLKNTLDYLESVVVQWGGVNCRSIGRNIRNIDKEVEFKEVKEFLDLLNKDKKDYKPSINSLINFQVQKVLSNHTIEKDSEYWCDKGWKDEIYYFPCKINPAKRILANGFYKMMSSKMKAK